MTQSLADLINPAGWPAFAMASGRVVGLVMIAPLWSLTAVPARVRGAIVVLLTAALLPAAGSAAHTTEAAGFVAPLAGELLLGLTVGLTAAMFLHGAAIAAEVVSTQMGLSLGAAFTPMPEITGSAVGEVYGMLTLAVYAALGGHLALVQGLAESLRAIPPGSALDVAAGGRAAVLAASGVFGAALRIAAPVMVALWLTNLALALVGKAVPQVNTMIAAIPVTVWVGLVMLAASLPHLVGLTAGWTDGLAAAATRTIATFAPVR